MKETKKFKSIEEMNTFLANGVTIYSVANAGTIWFMEYESGAGTMRTTQQTTSTRTVQDVIKEMLSINVIRTEKYIGYTEISGILQFITAEDEDLQRKVIAWLSASTGRPVTKLTEQLKDLL